MVESGGSGATSANTGGRCLRCGTPYEPDDTVCYHCGAPIGETEGDTAPVKIVRLNKSASDAASRVSAAGFAPDAPTDAPVAPQGEGPGVRTPPDIDLSRLTVGSAAAARTADVPIQKPRGRRGARIWLVTVLAVALALAALAGALYARHVATTAPPVAQQTPYADPAGRFHLLRPALWSASPTADGVSLTDSGGTSSVTVTIVTPGTNHIPAGISAATYADQLARQQGLSTPSGAGLPPRGIAGVQWEQRAGQATGSDGAVRETLLLVTAHGGHLYVIACTSPVASFAATQNLVFDPLLGSFTFDD